MQEAEAEPSWSLGSHHGSGRQPGPDANRVSSKGRAPIPPRAAGNCCLSVSTSLGSLACCRCWVQRWTPRIWPCISSSYGTEEEEDHWETEKKGPHGICRS